MPHHVSAFFIADVFSTLMLLAEHLSSVVWYLQFFAPHETPEIVLQPQFLLSLIFVTLLMILFAFGQFYYLHCRLFLFKISF